MSGAGTTTAPTVGTTTVATRVRDRAASDPTAVAMRHKDLGVWKEISWAEYWDTVLTTAHALLALGVIESGVGISSTRWFRGSSEPAATAAH